ncbi:MAG: helix-turn-helix domain-containing protein [Gammaproteobacteria bacterium]|nr:MAG: helix-turn-helix domain-containing protein [Gammaproteobacteria bacterium]
MKKPAINRRSYCPVTFALDIIGDRWALLIIRDILFLGKSNFGDFAKSPEGIATNILTDRLKRLEGQNIIAKNPDENNLSKYVYSLTDKGLDLLPIMVEMILFSEKHDLETAASKSTLKKIRTNKNKFIKELRQKHKTAFKNNLQGG